MPTARELCGSVALQPVCELVTHLGPLGRLLSSGLCLEVSPAGGCGEWQVMGGWGAGLQLPPRTGQERGLTSASFLGASASFSQQQGAVSSAQSHHTLPRRGRPHKGQVVVTQASLS